MPNYLVVSPEVAFSISLFLSSTAAALALINLPSTFSASTLSSPSITGPVTLWFEGPVLLLPESTPDFFCDFD
jgi:hypothetical protein